jgi:ParB-like chromosome segregation protein Spo0J
MKIQKFKLSDLNPAAYNPRKISKEALAGLSESLKKFGYISPIVCNIHNGENTIISGHQRVKALELQGINEVDCIIVDFDPLTEKAANIALNAETISGDWDLELLAPMLEELKLDFDDFEELNFDDLEDSFDTPSDVNVDDFFGETQEQEKAPKLCPHCGKEI